MARLSASVAPEVKTISLPDSAPMNRASVSRASSTAASASQPKRWVRLAALQNCDQSRLLRLFDVAAAAGASVDGRGRAAASTLAGVEVGETGDELVLESMQLRQLLAHAGQALLEDLAEIGCCRHPGGRTFLVTHDLGDLGQREPERLQLTDPAHALDRVGAKKTEASRRAIRGPQQAQALVQVQGAHRLAGEARQIP